MGLEGWEGARLPPAFCGYQGAGHFLVPSGKSRKGFSEDSIMIRFKL